MPEYKFVDMPTAKTDTGGNAIALAITAELNGYAAEGWSVVNALPSRIGGKTAVLLAR